MIPQPQQPHELFELRIREGRGKELRRIVSLGGGGLSLSVEGEESMFERGWRGAFLLGWVGGGGGGAILAAEGRWYRKGREG